MAFPAQTFTLHFRTVISHSESGELRCAMPLLEASGYLDSLCGAGPQLPAQDFFENVRKEADGDEQDDGQPGRAIGQHLYEHIVHSLIIEEWPGVWRERRRTTRWQVRSHREKHRNPAVFSASVKNPLILAVLPFSTDSHWTSPLACPLRIHCVNNGM